MEGCAERYTLLSCEPVSGRQHQIRRHAKISGHPVVGDLIRKLSSATADEMGLTREWLLRQLEAVAVEEQALGGVLKAGQGAFGPLQCSADGVCFLLQGGYRLFLALR